MMRQRKGTINPLTFAWQENIVPLCADARILLSMRAKAGTHNKSQQQQRHEGKTDLSQMSGVLRTERALFMDGNSSHRSRYPRQLFVKSNEARAELAGEKNERRINERNLVRDSNVKPHFIKRVIIDDGNILVIANIGDKVISQPLRVFACKDSSNFSNDAIRHLYLLT